MTAFLDWCCRSEIRGVSLVIIFDFSQMQGPIYGHETDKIQTYKIHFLCFRERFY